MMTNVRSTSSGTNNIRMGPLALFTLMTVICLAVLAILAISTANATLSLAQRRADATTLLYLDETSAQAFMAALDERIGEGADADNALRAASEAASLASNGQVSVDATHEGSTYSASFDAGNGRHLDIALQLEEDGSLSVLQWRMTTVVNDEPTMGNLFGSS